MNRRHFMMAGLAAGAASAVRPSFGQSANSKLNTGFIGVGNRGGYVMKSVKDLPGVQITALCDIKPDRLDAAATVAASHQPKTYTDWRELLIQPDLDVVFIATPCDLHVPMALTAMDARKHIYCEKPAGIKAGEIGWLYRAGQGYDKTFCVGQQMRSMATLQKAISWVHEGNLGEVVMVTAQRHASADLDNDGPSADWFFYNWRSGDVLVEMSVHNLDVCNWAINNYPSRAAGFGGNLLYKDTPPGRNTMDGYSLSYEYPNGVKLNYIQTFFHPSKMPAGSQLVNVYGEKGAVELLSGIFYPSDRNAQPVKLTEGIKNDDVAHQKRFYEAIRTGSKSPAGFDVACSGALTAIMGREAIYQKRVTTWAEMNVDIAKP
ncbi:MAG: Gfo/Idh/MocA family oxidoreductase [Bryobacterales bacterium]|nr:Gfo/Idh/MocA family oxidoreductase [Bryobacterales bacterium]